MLAKIQLTNRNKRMATHFNIMKTSKSRYPPQQTRPRPDTPARDRLDHRPGCTPSSPGIGSVSGKDGAHPGTT